MPQERQATEFDKKMGQIIARTWGDAAFKERLLKDPKAVAAEYGFTIPPGLEVRIVENTPSVVHVVLPAKPSGDLLSDEMLEAVAGGGCCAYVPPPTYDWKVTGPGTADVDGYTPTSCISC